MRFDVIGSAYAIVTNNPAQPLASSLTVLTDSAGTASVVLQVNANAPTQFAQMRVTDVTSGQQLVGNFTIVQNTDGSAILTVVPDTVTITGAFKGVCSSGFAIDYYIFGGTPPYRVVVDVPEQHHAGQLDREYQRRLLPGDHQRRVRRSADVLDRRRDGPPDDGELNNVEGHRGVPVAPPPALAVAPASVTQHGVHRQARSPLSSSGGTPPYNVSATSGTVVPVKPWPPTAAPGFDQRPD